MFCLKVRDKGGVKAFNHAGNRFVQLVLSYSIPFDLQKKSSFFCVFCEFESEKSLAGPIETGGAGPFLTEGISNRLRSRL